MASRRHRWVAVAAVVVVMLLVAEVCAYALPPAAAFGIDQRELNVRHWGGPSGEFLSWSSESVQPSGGWSKDSLIVSAVTQEARESGTVASSFPLGILDWIETLWDWAVWVGEAVWDGFAWVGEVIWDGTVWLARKTVDGVTWLGQQFGELQIWMNFRIPLGFLTGVVDLCAVLTEGQSDSYDQADLDVGQCVVDFLGLAPGIGIGIDLSNAVVSLGRTNWDDAAFSVVAAIPGIGTLNPKFAKYVDNIAKSARTDVLSTLNKYGPWNWLLSRANPIRKLEHGDALAKIDEKDGFARLVFSRRLNKNFTGQGKHDSVLTYTLGDGTRVTKVKGPVKNIPEADREIRNTHNLTDLKTHFAREGDEYGHLAAHAHGGTTKIYNIALQNRIANDKQQILEKLWSDLVEKDYEVIRTVEAVFEGGNKTPRPDSFRYTWSVDGVKQEPIIIKNNAADAARVEIPTHILDPTGAKRAVRDVLAAAAADAAAAGAAATLPRPGTGEPSTSTANDQVGSESNDESNIADDPSSEGVWAAVVGSLPSQAEALQERDDLARKYQRPFEITLTENGYWAVHTPERHASPADVLTTCNAMARKIPDDCYASDIFRTS